ncbi:M3 family oligoendopeptidase [Streptomyces sp. 130]|uniref:M3 family metallopeptidase n=1 Tax=Streptomyces sp. 130 TaxID=2591006 RepID=UPI00117E74EA|nr:M3 family metallopeptidase [Streptomyces sp. 130]TRV73993.1 M3 family oligoendopeptidase [Streptomyces sp. 130]
MSGDSALQGALIPLSVSSGPAGHAAGFGPSRSFRPSDVPPWDGSSLLREASLPQLEATVDEVLADARLLAEEMTGRLAELDPAATRAAIERYESCVARLQCATVHGELLGDRQGPAQARARDLTARCDRAWGELAAQLAFFEPELAQAEPQAQPHDDDRLPHAYAHFVHKVRAGAAHLLPDEQERVLARLLPTGGEGWGRLAERLLAGLTVTTEQGAVSIGAALPTLYAADRDLRRGTHAAISEALAGQAELRALALAMVVADGETRAELRGTDWLHERRIADQIGAEELSALLEAADDCLPVAHSYYALKRELLGIDDFADYDRYAPMGSALPEYSFGQAAEIASAAMREISPLFGDAARAMFDGGRIDARPRPGKKRGAHTQHIPGRLPHISMNFTGKARDVLTLTHELGHAVHLQLASEQPYLAAIPASVTGETVALFCEGVAVSHLLARSGDRAERIAWLARHLEDQLVAVCRHAQLHRFEAALYEDTRAGENLDAQRLGDLWMRTQGRMYGPMVHLTDGYRLWWSYLEPMFTDPGSHYAYIWGQLSALMLLRHFEADPAGFGPRLESMLRLGDSRPPAELIAGLLDEPRATWAEAPALLEERLRRLRALTGFPSPAGERDVPAVDTGKGGDHHVRRHEDP